MIPVYKNQVQLLLEVLPEVAKEESFVMHGGTAINLFVRDLPRLSVDIDLTFVDLVERDEFLVGMNEGLSRIQARINLLNPTIDVQHDSRKGKLHIEKAGVSIKVEVNMVGRGLLGEPQQLQLCEEAQDKFDSFCIMPVVPTGQLYGGKICAALDRQHPRDLFDVRLMLDNEAINDQIKQGFIFSLLCSNRPTHELLNPNRQDQTSAFEQQFVGMSEIDFSYQDYENTREELIELVNATLTELDKQFILIFNQLEPDWSHYDFKDFPSIKWKLLNLQKFKNKDLSQYQYQLEELTKILGLE
ncbi:nucleotidyl transferase AbiEii/AbiGii toxin family protein [Kangiella sp. TOML190]|uniref:nucleotidyl transferase AbiEii/AbiGii toxin family protein n=1 Tax=Kangiella sp. TOML190 TaxID=2931351 RepID=UPI00203E7676|nr:nucleotidyl transferase AbiEii/AbiGii toxin family protein [Kangiella sp. TOML190]